MIGRGGVSQDVYSAVVYVCISVRFTEGSCTYYDGICYKTRERETDMKRKEKRGGKKECYMSNASRCTCMMHDGGLCYVLCAV